METLELALEKVEQEVMPVIREAAAVAAAVVDQNGHDQAVEYLQRNATAIKFVKALVQPFVDTAKQAYEAAREKRDTWLRPLEEKRTIVEPAINAWRTEQARKRQDDQRRADEESRRRAEEEQLAAAEAAERAGDKAAAEAILQQPVVSAPVVLPKMESKGAPTVVSWSAEVADLWTLVQAVAKDRRLLPCLMADTKVLNQLAKAQKAEMNIPGVRVVRKEGLRVGMSRAA